MNPALQGLITIVLGVGGCVGYFLYSNWLIDKVVFPARALSADEVRPKRLLGSVVTLVLALLVGVTLDVALLGYLGQSLPTSVTAAIAWTWKAVLSPFDLASWLGGMMLGTWGAAILLAVAAVAYASVVGTAVGYASYRPRGMSLGDAITHANTVRPWLFLAPALVALGLYLAYPVVETLRLSLTERVPGGSNWVGLENYGRMSGEPKFWEALRNNMLWLIVVPAASTAFGLLAAQLTDRIKWGNIAKSLIFMPMAISFVGAAVIFKLIYDTRPVDQAQIGVLNALWLMFQGGPFSYLFLRIVPALILLAFAGIVAWVGYVFVRPLWQKAEDHHWALIPLRLFVAVAGLWLIFLSLRSILAVFTADFAYGTPQTWLTLPFWNNFFLMVVLIWIQTGFAMVILSAAIRGVPEDTIEAAIVDGANPFQIFFKIKVPQIMPTIVVVWTTITIVVLKVFDIVFAMTNGQWETQVLANYMYDKLFRANDWGVGSASAMVIMLLVTPILVWNVYNARKEMR